MPTYLCILCPEEELLIEVPQRHVSIVAKFWKGTMKIVTLLGDGRRVSPDFSSTTSSSRLWWWYDNNERRRATHYSVHGNFKLKETDRHCKYSTQSLLWWQNLLDEVIIWPKLLRRSCSGRQITVFKFAYSARVCWLVKARRTPELSQRKCIFIICQIYRWFMIFQVVDNPHSNTYHPAWLHFCAH